MIPEDLMRKYKYGYVHSCELLEEPFIKDLLKENQELKKQLEVGEEQYNDLVEEKESLQEQLSSNTLQLQTPEKEFIKYLEDEIVQNTPNARWKHYNEDGFNDYDVENPGCIKIQSVNKTLEEILQKYKKIIGGNNESR